MKEYDAILPVKGRSITRNRTSYVIAPTGKIILLVHGPPSRTRMSRIRWRRLRSGKDKSIRSRKGLTAGPARVGSCARALVGECGGAQAVALGLKARGAAVGAACAGAG